MQYRNVMCILHSNIDINQNIQHLSDYSLKNIIRWDWLFGNTLYCNVLYINPLWSVWPLHTLFTVIHEFKLVISRAVALQSCVHTTSLKLHVIFRPFVNSDSDLPGFSEFFQTTKFFPSFQKRKYFEGLHHNISHTSIHRSIIILQYLVRVSYSALSDVALSVFILLTHAAFCICKVRNTIYCLV